MNAGRSVELPPVSVVIPARNAESVIASALDSVAAQDYGGPVEAIVADSSDTPAMSEVVARRYPAVRLASNPQRTTPNVLNRLATVASFLASLIVLVLAARQQLGKGRVADDPVVGAVATLTVHACYVMATGFNTVELRYAAAMWPFQAVYGLVLVRWMLNTCTACAGSAGRARWKCGRAGILRPAPGRR